MTRDELIKWHINYRMLNSSSPGMSEEGYRWMVLHGNPSDEELERQKTVLEEQEAQWRKSPPKTCSICGEKYYGWGNNAWPVNEGRCCNECNSDSVIPARLRGVQGPMIPDKSKRRKGGK